MNFYMNFYFYRKLAFSTVVLLTAIIPVCASAYEAALSPDETLLAVARNNEVKIWRTDSGALLRTIDIGPLYSPGQNYMRTTVSFSPDSKMLATSTGYIMVGDWNEAVQDDLLHGKAQVWDLERGHLLWKLQNDDFYLTVFSPDSKSLAVSASLRPFALHDARTGKKLRQFAYRSGALDKIIFSPDSKFVYAVTDKLERRKDAGLWSTQTGKLLKTKEQANLALSKFAKKAKLTIERKANSVELRDAQTGELKRIIEIDKR